MSALIALFRREFAAGFGRGGGPLFALAFYLGVAALLPLAEGPAPERLRAVAPGAAFVALALASLLSLERLFERDFEDGALDLLALSATPLEVTAAIKCKAQWWSTGLPLGLASPVVAVMLGAPATLMPAILAASLLAGLAFAFTGGIGAALTLGARRGGLLTAVIVLPLYAPPVVFGAGAVEAFANGLDGRTGLMLLLAYTLTTVALAPFAMAAACRSALG